MRIPTLGLEIGFGARHKEAARVVQAMEPFEVEIASVHDVEGTWLGQPQVEDIDVVQFAVADVQERGNVAAQIQKRVQLDGRLGRAKRSPRKHRQAQVDGAGIQRVDRVFQIDAKRLPGIQATGDSNERLGKLGIDTPVAHFVASASVLRETRLLIPMWYSCPLVRAGTLRCRASSRDRSVGQRPCRDIARGRKSS